MAASESGALNESFSDVIGTAVESWAAEPISSSCTLATGQTECADWLLAEDLDISDPADAQPGFRNMADPQEDGDPDHYDERYEGRDDNGGVHSNSGISNHAFYLLSEGGRNAGCDATGSDGHTHTANCDVVVTGIGLEAARDIFFLGYTGLPEDANICQARMATSASAGANTASVAAAWTAVGVLDGCEPNPTTPPCLFEDVAIPFESTHPYASNLDCTWTYDNGAGGYALHFSLLDIEPGFDHLFVTDADGTMLHDLSGRYRGGFTTDCISTSEVTLRLVTDQYVNRRGFIVDAVTTC